LELLKTVDQDMTIKKIFCVRSLVVAIIAFLPGLLDAQPAKPVLSTIIVDPGHGGVDPGAKGQLNTEANVSLSIALKLGKALEAEFPNTKIIYTRTTDELPGGLTDKNEANRFRAQMANEARGDLYISIHANAAGKKAGGWYARRRVGTKKVKNRKGKLVSVPVYENYYQKNHQHGTETFIWAADRNVFKTEAITMTEEEGGEASDDSTDILDMNSPEAMVRAQLYEKKFFAKSLQLATLVEEEFVKSGRVSRGVKQRNEKGIWVLQATGMPSVLVETGFVTNTEEEEYINSEKGQEEIVNAILSAVKRYYAWLEENKSSTGSSNTF
jgi:N-acetylmuramoyl-L-alanine amidase